MKDKEADGFVEKDRTFRDRTKRRREDSPPLHIPRMEPYKRKKDWMQLPMEDDLNEDENLTFCPEKERWYNEAEYPYGCPYCLSDGGS
jgi:hypothetical protein